MTLTILMAFLVLQNFYWCLYSGVGQRGGAREKMGWEGYRKWQRKRREAGVLRGWEAGEKCEALIFLIQQYINDNSFKNKNPCKIYLTCI